MAYLGVRRYLCNMGIWSYVICMFVIGGGLEVYRRSRPKKLTADEMTQVADLARQGQHIEAMRAYRKLSNASLREAKEVVEKLVMGPGP